MQSHHRSFPSQLGHRRRPSIGKSMPVTALLMNLPAPNQMQRYTTYAGDSSTPEAQKPPMVFDLSELEELESRKGESGDYCNNCKENCPSFKGEISTPYPALEKLCTLLCNKKCNESQIGGCNIIETPSTKTRPPATLDENRRKFLNDILSSYNENNSKNVSKTSTEDLGGPIDFRQKPGIAEALAKTSMMTSPAAKRRLAARKIELERDHYNNSPTGSDDEKEFIPPRELLLYLVRMGSFNSTPRINNSDTQDDTLEIPQGLTTNDMLHHCKIMRGEDLPKLLDRSFLKSSENAVSCNDITDGVRVLKLNAFSKICSKPVSSPKHLRILQWNILSQTLGQNNDGFVRCPDEALTWENRKYLIVEEIIKSNPDVICLQEVDHFKFLERVLGTQNYTGIFFPKPDSPCLYIEENNGPDGCAIFYKRDKFDLINYETRILEVWRVQSNQVAIAANLKIIETGKEICICTTHLKARNGALLSKLRNEQGKDLLKFVNEISEDRPVLICGDFNAEPIEPVYSTVLNNKLLGLCSAYAEINAKEKAQSEKSLNNDATDCCSDNQVGEEVRTLSSAEVSAKQEPPYTTWKIREEGEVCHTIDYVFYSKKALKVTNCLSFPDEGEIGKNRTPSFQYPSDHFSLVCDFEILEGQQS